MKWIDDCRSKWWRLWSLRWAAAKSVVIAGIFAAPQTVESIVSSLPPAMQAAFPAGLVMGLVALDAIFRLAHQPKVSGNASDPPAA